MKKTSKKQAIFMRLALLASILFAVAVVYPDLKNLEAPSAPQFIDLGPAPPPAPHVPDKFERALDIFAPDFEDPYNFASTPHPFTDYYGWALRVREMDGLPDAEYVAEVRKTGNPFALVFMGRRNGFWMDMACRLGTSAWAYSCLTNEDPKKLFENYYFLNRMNVPIEHEDPHTLYIVGMSKKRPESVMLAAEAGLPAAMTEVGKMYGTGRRNIGKDPIKSFYITAEAARRGDPDAWEELSYMYSGGVTGLFPHDTKMAAAAAQVSNYLQELTVKHRNLTEAEKAFPEPLYEGYDTAERLEIIALARSWAYKTRELMDQRGATLQKEYIDPQLPRINREIDEYLQDQKSEFKRQDRN